MKNLVYALMMMLCMTTLAHANCGNGVCSLANRAVNVTRSVVSVPVRVVRNVVDNKPVRRLASVPVRVVQKCRPCCRCN